jgi:hypothetical protein
MPERTEWIVVDDLGVKLRASETYVVLEDHWISETVEIVLKGDGEPETYARVEVSESGPKLVELRFTATDPDASGIRQSDLRGVQVSALLEDLVAMFTFRVDKASSAQVSVASAAEHDVFVNNLRVIGNLRMGKTSRSITPQLLERVAKVYRDNISHTPTKAVEHHFQVSQRMAAEYVSRARKRGLLPPTKRGKKQA